MRIVGVDMPIALHLANPPDIVNAIKAEAARNCVLASDFVGIWIREDDCIVEGIQFEGGCTLDLAALEKNQVSAG